MLFLSLKDGEKGDCAPIRPHVGMSVTRAAVLKHKEENFGFALFVMLS